MKKQMHYQDNVLERFIPISFDRLVLDLLSSNLLPAAEKKIAFQQFCHAYAALYHAKSYKQLQKLKTIYWPFNPDRDVLFTKSSNPEKQLTSLKSELYHILEKANFEKLSPENLNEALNKISPHGVKVSVDFDEFSEVALFYRGSATHTEVRRNVKKFQFKKLPYEIQVYRRLFVLLQPKNREQRVNELIQNKKMSPTKAVKKVDSAFKALGISGKEDVVYMKLFKDIPTADLEMLFPNTRVKMRLFDKIKLGVMGGGGSVGGIMATITKFSAAIDPISALLAIGTLLGVIWRQIAKIFSQRAKYSAILTKNLYFYSLDNNMGALTYLIDAAEAEECKEAVLAYFFLLIDGETSREELDKRIETYIQNQYSLPMDFEINDGLEKLQKLGLLSQYSAVIQAIPLADANERLKQDWSTLLAR
jgi:DNA-directed RNA polymerase subunit F